MLPMETNYALQEGIVTERTKAYYRRRANDVGLILIQITCVDSVIGKGYVNQLCIDDDRMIPGLRELADTIHQGGAKVIIQLHHAGANARGENIVAASPLPLMPGKTIPKPLSVNEIEGIVSQYTQ